MYGCIIIPLYVHVYACVCTRACACVCVCIYVCVFVRVCMRVCVYIYSARNLLSFCRALFGNKFYRDSALLKQELRVHFCKRIHRHAHIEIDLQTRSVYTQQELQKRPVCRQQKLQKRSVYPQQELQERPIYMQQELWKRLFEVPHHIQPTGSNRHISTRNLKWNKKRKSGEFWTLLVLRIQKFVVQMISFCYLKISSGMNFSASGFHSTYDLP